MTVDPEDADAIRLATESLAAGDATGWFERLYAEASDGSAIVPWDRGVPNASLVAWSADRPPASGRAVVVGCGLGSDAEHVASLGYETTAFDISPSAVAGARSRHAGSAVQYVVANLLDLPVEWLGGFDLVLESYTVQSLPVELHPVATAAVTSLVAPGGTLLIVAMGAAEAYDGVGPPWPLSRAEVDAFGTADVQPVSVEQTPGPAGGVSRWRAEFRRAG